MCAEGSDPIVVLEHDALFTRKFATSDLTEQWKGGIIGLNNPIGATRRAHVFDAQVKKIHGLGMYGEFSAIAKHR